MFEEIANKISDDLINYKNKEQKSLNNLFNLFLNKYGNYSIQDNNTILIKTIHFLTKKGYDITSTHPFALNKYK